MAEAKIKHEVVVVKHLSSDLDFKSKSDAFDHFFAANLNSGMDAVEAAERAGKVAAAIGKAKGLPDKNPDAVEQGIQAVNKFAAAAQQHPKMAELVTGFILGLFGGKAAATETKEVEFDQSKTNINLEDIE